MADAARTDAARSAAFEALRRVEKEGAFSNLVAASFRKLSQTDERFATALVLGALERKRTLDFVISRAVKRMPDTDLLLLLRLGVLQILYFDRVPDSAACDETVKLAKQLFDVRRAGFVNAVLRQTVREKNAVGKALQEQPAAVRFSVSDGIAALLQEQYPDTFEEILDAFGQRKPLHLRVNPLKGNVDELAERLQAQADGDMLTVDEQQSQAVRGAQSGEYLIQGYGSQTAVRLLGAQSGDTVLDVCACPGGKSFGAAMDMRNRGEVISMDLHANKLSLIEKGAAALGISIIRTAAHDARTADKRWIGKADRVICDVPCSGLGVIGAKPEIRYKDPTAFERLYELQREILCASAAYVKAGGTLVYSTCTLNRKENEEVVAAFLQENHAFRLETQHTCFPYEQAGEGFFAAKLIRI